MASSVTQVASTAFPASTLVLGGARSGKSAYAESLVESVGGGVYLATAQARDAEMAERIRHHRQRRGDHWTTIEEPLDIVAAMRRVDGEADAILVDCLTLWLSNLLETERTPEDEFSALADWLTESVSPIVLVANEVGLGIVPDNALARRFRDLAGALNRLIASRAERVTFVAVGLPMDLK